MCNIKKLRGKTMCSYNITCTAHRRNVFLWKIKCRTFLAICKQIYRLSPSLNVMHFGIFDDFLNILSNLSTSWKIYPYVEILPTFTLLFEKLILFARFKNYCPCTRRPTIMNRGFLETWSVQWSVSYRRKKGSISCTTWSSSIPWQLDLHRPQSTWTKLQSHQSSVLTI